MPRFAVDFLDVLLPMLRDELEPDDVTVMSRIPDGVENYLPLVVVRRTGGDSPAPEFFDDVWVNVQCWTTDRHVDGTDQYRDASDLADRVRGIFWTAYRTQQVIPGVGWIAQIRESSGPIEISDPDLVLLGRVTATYELRVRRPAA
jgi:hypothetical protein